MHDIDGVVVVVAYQVIIVGNGHGQLKKNVKLGKADYFFRTT